MVYALLFNPWGRELELSAKKMKIQKKKSHRYLTLFRMLVTDWPGKISGISCKSDCCDGCVMFQLCRSVLFLPLAGRNGMPMVIWESWTAYSIWARMILLISALITFSTQKQRLLLNRWAPSRKWQWFRCNYLSGTIYWSAPLDNRDSCSCRHAYLMEVMVACH